MHICYIIAMQAEAQPFIDAFNVKEQEGAFAPLPCRLYQAEPKAGKTLSIVTLGRQHERDLVGCEAASVATLAAVEKLHPDLVVNSGTCGAWARKGADIGNVYVADSVMFHDRRVPGDDDWDTQGLGNYPVWEGSREMAERLALETGKVTTGSSLDLQPCDEVIIEREGGELKDMEGAAVAFVCSLTGVPVMLIKSVTDLCDDSAPTLETFLKNLHLASERLAEVNRKAVELLLS